MNEKILIVDDEQSIVDVLSYALKRDGFNIETAYNGREALEKIRSFNPHIIILDLMLPIINGYEVCKQLNNDDIGIIMLTAKDNVIDKVLGLELGADDYITKPFNIRELTARVKSLSRRFKKTSFSAKDSNIIRCKDLIIDYLKHTVTVENKALDFTVKEFELLYLLLSNPEIVYSRDQLLNIIWKLDYFGGTRTVDTHVQRIRRKLGSKYENTIVTIHGVGYKGVMLFEAGN